MSDDLTTADVSSALRRTWWLPVLRGVVLLVLGLLMLVQPLWSVTALVWIFGIFAILDGMVTIFQWFANRQEAGAGSFLLSGSSASRSASWSWSGPPRRPRSSST